MKVTLDASRIVHLLVLIGGSWAGAALLVSYLDWTPLAAFGLACAVVTQISNLVMPQQQQQQENTNAASASSSSSGDQKGNPKKRKTQRHHKNA